MALSARLTIRTPELVTRIPARVTTLGDMTKQLKNPLVWIDCEMTGLDVAHDALIEVAVVITDASLTVVDPGIDILIQPSEEALNHMDDYVRNMHTQSGLLDELKDGIASMEEAESIVLDYIKKFVPVSGRALLAGNTVGMDRLFLSANMPRVIDHLHYRIIDVSSIKELAKRWYPCVYECSSMGATAHWPTFVNPSRNLSTTVAHFSLLTRDPVVKTPRRLPARLPLWALSRVPPSRIDEGNALSTVHCQPAVVHRDAAG